MIIVALLIAISLVPARCTILINSDGAQIDIKYLFLKLCLFPREKNVVKVENENEETKKKSNKKKQFDILTAMLGDIIKTTKRLLGYIFHYAVTIEELSISAAIGTKDPADTGMLCGGAYAVIYQTIGMLNAHTKIKRHSVEISPDFENEVISGGLFAVIRTRIAHLIIILFMLLKLITKYITISRRIK